jgi:hypothetical protein
VLCRRPSLPHLRRPCPLIEVPPSASPSSAACRARRVSVPGVLRAVGPRVARRDVVARVGGPVAVTTPARAARPIRAGSRDHLTPRAAAPPGASDHHVQGGPCWLAPPSTRASQLREDPRGAADRGARPRRDPERLVRLAHRPGSRGDLRRDLADRGQPGQDGPELPQPPVRGPEVLRRGVQGEGLHLRRAAVRHRRVPEQGGRHDQVPDGLHGRLPRDDRQGDLHHQRHRARGGLPARALAGRVLRHLGGQDHRP